MSTDEQTRQSLTFPSDALETALDQLPVGTITDDQEAYARDCCSILDTHQYASGRSPSGLAAASIYLAALIEQESGYYSDNGTEPLSQDEVAEYCGVSAITIRSHYRKILEIKNDFDETDSETQDLSTVGDLP